MSEDTYSKEVVYKKFSKIILENEDVLIDKYHQNLLDSDDDGNGVKIIDAAKLLKIDNESKDLWNALTVSSAFDKDGCYFMQIKFDDDKHHNYIVIDSCKAPETGYSLCKAIDLRLLDKSYEFDVKSRTKKAIEIAHGKGISDIEICKFIDYIRYYYRYNDFVDAEDIIKYCKDEFNIEYKCTIDEYSTRFMIVGECPDKKLSKFTFRDLIRKYAVVYHDDETETTWFLITHKQKFFNDNKFLSIRRDNPIVKELERVGGASFTLYHYADSDKPDAEAEAYSICNDVPYKLLMAHEDEESINSELISVLCSLTITIKTPVTDLSVIGFLTLLNRIERAFGI